jgi:hypothetical protein
MGSVFPLQSSFLSAKVVAAKATTVTAALRENNMMKRKYENENYSRESTYDKQFVLETGRSPPFSIQLRPSRVAH